MKREGRQHGVVRTYWRLPSPSNPAPLATPSRRTNAPPSACLFTKVPSKPTNHSKFTGKCEKVRCLGCRIHPIAKSRDKTKGTQKRKSSDVVNNYRLITWRVVGGRTGLKFSGFSATGILDQLSNDYDQDYYEHGDNSADYGYDYEDYDDGSSRADEYGLAPYFGALVERKIRIRRPEMEEITEDEDEDDDMGFVDVGIALERGEEDEGWFLVGEI